MKKVIIVLLVMVLCGCQKTIKEERSLFSWHSQDILDDKQLFDMMERYSINSLYQNFKDDDYDDFFKLCLKKKISVYDLCGQPDFALKEKKNDLNNVIDESIELKETYTSLQGIVLDIEPYLLEQWKNHQDQIVKEFLENLKMAYQKCHNYHLQMIVCIPYYYDTFNQQTFLKKLIQSYCDGIAIMNYYKKNESQHIEQEVKLCQTYHKQCVVIYEMNQPHQNGITEMNSYYKEGIDQAIQSFNKIKKEYNEEIIMSFHDYRALCQIEQSQG